MEATHRFDVVLVGGGLQNGLIALAALRRNPKLRIAMVERDARPGGNHTWCLHAADVPAAARKPTSTLLVVARWPGYDVRFPTLGAPHRGRLRGDELGPLCRLRAWPLRAQPAEPAAALRERRARWAATRCCSRTAASCKRRSSSTRADRSAGASERAAASRSSSASSSSSSASTACTVPLLMDASVPQLERLSLLLRAAARPAAAAGRGHVLRALAGARPAGARVTRCSRYAARYGRVQRVVREETGVLPMPWDGAHEAPTGVAAPRRLRGRLLPPGDRLLVSGGAAAGRAHRRRAPRTRCSAATLDALRARTRARRATPSGSTGCCSTASRPTDMWHVFERFYRLPEPLIHRFYALALTPPRPRADPARDGRRAGFACSQRSRRESHDDAARSRRRPSRTGRARAGAARAATRSALAGDAEGAPAARALRARRCSGRCASS